MLAVVGVFADIPFVSNYAFWVAVAAYVILYWGGAMITGGGAATNWPGILSLLLAAATWGVATHEWTRKRFFKATYTVCQADYKEFCPSQSEYLPCDANWQEWAAKECGNFVAEFEPERHYESCQRGGYCPRCYPLVVQVTCRANK